MNTPLNTPAIDTDGTTPDGHPFTIRAYISGGKCVSRALLWHSFNGVGSISIPMRAECWFEQLYYQLTRLGAADEETARNCFSN